MQLNSTLLNKPRSCSGRCACVQARLALALDMNKEAEATLSVGLKSTCESFITTFRYNVPYAFENVSRMRAIGMCLVRGPSTCPHARVAAASCRSTCCVTRCSACCNSMNHARVHKHRLCMCGAMPPNAVPLLVVCRKCNSALGR
jgi:hypothetical protein